MSTKIILKKSSVASKIPTTGDLDYGELAINYQDGKLWYKNASNNIKAFIDSAGMQTAINNAIAASGSSYGNSDVETLVDSAYVQLRQDYAYSSLTGTPTIPSLYTDFVDSAEGRKLISVTDNGGDGSLTYDNTTGVITYTGPSASEVRAHFTGGSNINISNGVISLDSALDVPITFMEFSPQNPVPAHAEGRVFYHGEHKALTVYNDVSDVSLQVGQEEWVRVYNNTGSTITNGTPVYITGATGGTPTVAPGDASTSSKAEIIGLATHDIADATNGYVTARGLVSGLDTSSLTAGSKVHLAADGTLQSSAPTYPYYPTEIGHCIVVDSSAGYIYVNTAQHFFEQFRVTGATHLNGNLTVNGDLTVNGTQSIVTQANLAIDNSFVYLNSGDTIGDANTTFTGSGLDDAYFTGHYHGTTTKSYYVEIDGVGTGTGGVDTFKWSYNSDLSSPEATTVDITGVDQALGENINIFFNATTGHTSGDKWSGSASPLNTDTGWFTNRNTGGTGVGYTHVGVYFDVSDTKFKFVDEYLPEPEGTIDAGDSSFSLATVVASVFEGNLTGNVTGTVSSISNHTTSELTEGSNLYYTTARADSDFDIRLALKSTSDLSEGTNKYYTTVRVDSDIDLRVTKAFIDNLNVNADTLDGQHGTYYRINVYNSSGTLLN